MKNGLIFFNKKKLLYNKFHKNGRFSSINISSIVERVRFNQLKLYKRSPNYEILKASGIDTSLPIYIEKMENINISYAKNLWLAQKIENFNLVVFYNKKSNKKSINAFLKNSIFLEQILVSKEIKSSLNLANINFEQSKELETRQNEEIIIKNYTLQKVKEDVYFKTKMYNYANNNIEVEQTFCDGRYYFFNGKNNNQKRLNIEINILLKSKNKTYFFIEKINNGIKIINLINKKINYFIFPKILFTYKLFLIKNSYNYKLQIICNCKNVNNFFCYYGKEMFCVDTMLSADAIKENIIKKLNNKFNIKINCEDKKLSNLINIYLPKLIIKKEICEKANYLIKNNNISFLINLYKTKKINAYCLYINLINCFVTKNEKSYTFNKINFKNYQIEITLENEKKLINIHDCDKTKMVVDGIAYYNTTTISSYALKKCNQFDIFM